MNAESNNLLRVLASCRLTNVADMRRFPAPFLLPRRAQNARPDGRHLVLLLLDRGDAVAPPRVPPRDGRGRVRRRGRDQRVPHQVLHHAAAPAAPNHPAHGRPPRLPDPRGLLRRRRVRMRHGRAPLLLRRPLARCPLREGERRLVLRRLAAEAAVVAADAALHAGGCKAGDAETTGPRGGGAAAAPHPATSTPGGR